jgi:hypothetical protein
MEQKVASENIESTGRACVYCGQRGNLTNEHVVPDFYHKTFGETISIVKTPSGDKAIPSPQEIGDVCANCNNAALSRLDSYLADLTKKYFSTIVKPGDRIQFAHDSDLLLRTMLKVAYNVARTRNQPIEVFQEAREFILGENPRPSGFRVFVQVLVPTPARKTHLPVTPGTTEIPPLPWRADLYDVRSLPGLKFACSVSFMSYRFFILREDANVPTTIRNRSVVRWLKENKGATELTDKGRATLYPSSVTVLDALKGNPTFETQLAKARKLKADMKLTNSARRNR